MDPGAGKETVIILGWLTAETCNNLKGGGGEDGL
jgi:hypothetical protein